MVLELVSVAVKKLTFGSLSTQSFLYGVMAPCDGVDNKVSQLYITKV